MVKWKVFSLVMAIMMVVSCGLALAQTRPKAPPPQQGTAGKDTRMEQGIDMMFKDMDTSQDDKISKDEWLAVQEKQFNRLDKNRDGFLTRDEVRADLEQMRQEHEKAQRGGGRAPQ